MWKTGDSQNWSWNVNDVWKVPRIFSRLNTELHTTQQFYPLHIPRKQKEVIYRKTCKWAGKMVQQVRVLAVKTSTWVQSPGPTWQKEKAHSNKLSSDFPICVLVHACVCACMHMCMCIHVIKLYNDMLPAMKRNKLLINYMDEFGNFVTERLHSVSSSAPGLSCKDMCCVLSNSTLVSWSAGAALRIYPSAFFTSLFTSWLYFQLCICHERNWGH